MGKKNNKNKNKNNKTAAAVVVVGTAQPSGLSVTRSGGTFTCSWKVGDEDYNDGTWIRYQVGWGGISGDIGVAGTSWSINLGAVARVAFGVKGKRSAYTTTATTKNKKGNTKTVTTTNSPAVSGESWIDWVATIPAAPSLSYTNNTSNSGTFTWSVSTNDSGTDIFTHVELQTCTSRNNANPPGSGWSGSTRGASGSVSYTETLGGNNIVRWVRVRSWGPAGASGWVYAHHAYGNPATPNLTSARAEALSQTIRITASWYGGYGIINPIDDITVQYAIDTPTNTSFTAPASGWSDAIKVASNGGHDRVVVNAPELVGTDECVWVRVMAKHDDFSTYSNAILAHIGTLATPGINAVPDPTSGDVPITITENTDCTVACTAIFYRSEKKPNLDQIVAVLPNGTTTVTVNIPEIATSYSDPVETTCFGAWAFVGSYNGLTVNPRMRSGIAIDSDIVARPPAWLELNDSKTEDSVRIRWPWTWSAATQAELSWADHDDAWESTDEPSKYLVDNKNVTSWIIASLDVGKMWYFRVRLIGDDDGEELKGPWSDMYSHDLSCVPTTPALTLSKNVVNDGDILTARWAYTSDDGTTQAYADICLATYDGNGNITYGDIIAHTQESQTVDIEYDWVTGTTYYLCVRTTSSAGQQSAWSDPASLYAAEPIDLEITEHSLEITGDLMYLTEMPMTVTATGAGASGTTIVSVVRAEEYHIDRPDGSDFDGFEGESIATYSQQGEAQVTITTDDLVGCLDDGAKYKLLVTVVDEFEQTETTILPFTVDWTHQAGKPSATVKVDEFQRISIITPIAPANYEEGDVCDIYRLSTDKPELIVKGAEFGTAYVDPFPAFGMTGGHRIVTRTANGDYITADNKLAWYKCDSEDLIEEDMMIIDVNGDQIELPYNLELTNSWTKDFKRTAYLGGSVKGDWNPAVTRDLSARTIIIKDIDIDTQVAMRDLAGYAGVAHIRTPEGSSFAADIQIRETQKYNDAKISYELTIKAVDPDEPEGMTYTEWQSFNPVD